ncbi:MAG: glycerol-3-phosphate dehydrogenase/oxidase [Flavobacteriales bacterium]|nr:glycerol-3-phosphate dehydrogenase/oxidase [Flavobacteriales bacterium]
MDRPAQLRTLRDAEGPWDILVIGGGASGLGVAVDAAARGLRTVLLEAHDFAKGTSSRSTKLVHGGVRYLAQGHVGLVREALRERGRLLRNAPHLCHDQAFVIPCYRWWEAAWYRIGLGLYDLLAGKLSLGRTRMLNKAETLQHLPGITSEGLRGGILYHDGQFDDARLAVALARTAVEHGACVLNHARVVQLLKDDEGKVIGAVMEDALDGKRHTILAKVVVNCTGVFTNAVLAMDSSDTRDHIVPSQGIHLVLDRSFMPGDAALMIPRTPDGRVLFAIPWQDKLVVGTTDIPVAGVSEEPKPLPEEIAFVLETVGRYLVRPPLRSDVLSMYAGLRPLAKQREGQRTSEISRGHRVLVSDSGLVSLIGGKWTTYRSMAEDVLDQAMARFGLKAGPCNTAQLPIHGKPAGAVDAKGHLAIYGSDAAFIRSMMQADPSLSERLHPTFPYTLAEVVYAVRFEMASTLEDVLARRVRLLFLDARAASDSAPKVALLMAHELGEDEAWVAEQLATFAALAAGYRMNA